MDRKKEMDEVSAMLRGVPARNILISFDGKPAKTLEEHLKEQGRSHSNQKRRKERERE